MSEITINNELEKLQEQKKIIEDRIKAITCNYVRNGHAVFDYDTVSTQEYRVRVERIYYNNTRKGSYQNGSKLSIVRGKEKDKVIEGLDTIIADLTGLRDRLIKD